MKRLTATATWLIVAFLIFMGLDLIIRGASGFHIGYLFEAPTDLGRSGGIGPMMLSTLIIVGSATLLATCFSLPCAIAFTELVGPVWFRRGVQMLLDIGVGTPRIVWGLFGGIFFGGILGLGFSMLCGILTLSCLLAPILVTGFIDGLRAVDPALREQCAALGISPWHTCWRQVIPAASPALIASVALAAGRGCGDAAALIFTAGLATDWLTVHDSSATLAVFIFNLLSSVPAGQNAAYTAAAVLFLLTFLIQMAIAQTHQKENLAR